MPRFDPFPALRYPATSGADLTALTSPPYDVFDEAARELFAANGCNIVHVDYPVEKDGPGRYEQCARILDRWRRDGTLVEDDMESFTIYRMSFVDDAGRARTTVGVVGALEVVDEGAGGVLPHEQTTPKAKTDRLDLTRTTRANLSPVWGLSLAPGLSRLLADPGAPMGRCVDPDGVVHVVERVTDPARVAAVSELVSSQPVLIADGHHRYAVSRTYRDECRLAGGPTAAELTMTFVQELVEEQLSVAAIHRLYDVDATTMREFLSARFDIEEAGRVGPSTLIEMETRGCLCLVDGHGAGWWLTPRESGFEGVRGIDSARLEHALEGRETGVRYQHGVVEVLDALAGGHASSAVLIRPVSLEEIERTARTGDLMPPKSTFFTPKIRTGLVMRRLDA